METVLFLLCIGLCGACSFHYFKRAAAESSLFALPACTWLAAAIRFLFIYLHI